MKKIATLLFISVMGLGLTGRATAQADATPPEPKQNPASDKNTVIQKKDTVKQQKATANPLGLSNPENVKTKQVMTSEQKEASRAHKKYEKQQKKEKKKTEKAEKKASSHASKAHLNGK